MYTYLLQLNIRKNVLSNPYPQADSCSSSCTALQDSSKRSHGGEITALDEGWQSKEIPVEISAHLLKLGPLKLACNSVVFHYVIFVCAVVYLLHSDGSIEKEMLSYSSCTCSTELANFVVSWGDLDVLHNDFLESGWTETFKVKSIHLACSSTLSTTWAEW